MATNQQRREAAKRKLDRQLMRKAERAKRRKIVGVGVTIGAVVVVAGLVVFFATKSSNEAEADNAGSSSTPQQKRPRPLPNPISCEYPSDGEPPAKAVNPPSGQNVSSSGTVNVTMHSTAGDIPLTLDRELAPCAVNSFVSLAQQRYYTNTECHRLGTASLPMLQCGDPEATGRGGPGYTVPDENFPGLKYNRGVLAMAKKSAPNSGGSQFFMVYGDAQLPPDYTVFGTISGAGLEVLDAVARDGLDPATASPDGTGKPKTPVKFTDVTVDA